MQRSHIRRESFKMLLRTHEASSFLQLWDFQTNSLILPHISVFPNSESISVLNYLGTKSIQKNWNNFTCITSAFLLGWVQCHDVPWIFPTFSRECQTWSAANHTIHTGKNLYTAVHSQHFQPQEMCPASPAISENPNPSISFLLLFSEIPP